MLNRRGLLGGFGLLLSTPAIIRTPGLLMPVHSPRPLRLLTEADLTWSTHLSDLGLTFAVAAQYRTADGRMLRHGVRMSKEDAAQYGLGAAKERLLASLNEARRLG